MSANNESDPSEPISQSERSFDGAPSEAVITAVAEATGRSPLEMEPLWEAIDPDALDVLVGRRDDRDRSATVTFEYCEHRITVSSGRVQLTRRKSSDE